VTWLSKLRLRLLVFVIGVPLAAFAAMSLSPSWLAIPVVGVAVYAVALGLQKASSRLAQPTCWTCGADLSSEPEGDHGRACPSCGALHQSLAHHDQESPETDEDSRA